MKKDCGELGCPNDHRSQVLARGDGVIELEWRLLPLALFGPPAMSDSSRQSVMRTKADVYRRN
jgi:hypothetical protein